ncbi:MAG: tetratricopeptide repeat protein [Phycisphaerae bacterium]
MAEAETSESGVTEGPGKGQAYFTRAHTVADTGNYDYAIDMFIQGLLREPTNMAEHEMLRDIALRRKIKGGKPAGGIVGGLLGAKPYFKGKTPKELMLNAEWALAKDPGNINLMMTMLRQATAAGYKDIVLWFGPFVMQANRTQKKPDGKLYLQLADIYEGFKEFAKAGEAVTAALELSPADPELTARVKELGTRETLLKGRYESVPDFKESLRDKEMTKDLLQKENISKSEEYKNKLIRETREAWEKNPTDPQLLTKYVKALVDAETQDSEKTAIEVLEKAYLETKIYRYKVWIGDVRIKQLRRQHRALLEKARANPDDPKLAQQLADFERDRLKFELDEYADRVKNYPSDLQILFEYGYRLFRSQRYEEAIGVLQQAQNNPRCRTDALHLLGRSFLEQSMTQEAVDTLRRAVESYELAETGDTKSKEINYWLGRSLEAAGQLDDAEKIYSHIAQWDIAFRDARLRLAELRKRKG